VTPPCPFHSGGHWLAPPNPPSAAGQQKPGWISRRPTNADDDPSCAPFEPVRRRCVDHRGQGHHLAYDLTAGSRAKRMARENPAAGGGPPPESHRCCCALCLWQAQRLLAELAALECKEEVLLPMAPCRPLMAPYRSQANIVLTNDATPLSELPEVESTAGRLVNCAPSTTARCG